MRLVFAILSKLNVVQRVSVEEAIIIPSHPWQDFRTGGRGGVRKQGEGPKMGET